MKEIFKYIPGFRSNVTWKKVVATIYYLSTLVALTMGFAIFLVNLVFPFFVFYTVDFFIARKRYKTSNEDGKSELKVVMNKSLCGALICFIIIGIAASKAPKVDTQNTETKTNKTVTATKGDIKKDERKDNKDNKQDSAVTQVSAKTAENKLTGELKVHFIDVGQADSILVQQGDQAMLVDAGNKADDKTVKSYLDKVGVKELNTVIGTHPHEDHIGGMDYIINSFKIGKIYMPKATATTKTFENVLTAIKNKGMSITSPKVGESFNIGQAKCTILAPNGTKYEDLNDYSIVVKVEFGQNSFLLTGDAEAISEMEMVKANANLKADVFKVGHHGSKSSTCANFLSSVNPKYAVISVGKENDYGHPAQATMDRLKSANIQVFRTDENSSIIATSDGKTINFNVQPGSYNGVTEKVQQQVTNTNQATESKSAPQPTQQTNNNEVKVWLSATGKCYHSRNNCGNMNPNKARQVTLEQAKQSYSPCSKCHPPQ